MGNIHPSRLLQPPPPRFLPAACKEENIKPEVVGGNLRSCKRKRLTEIESLPDEVLFDVLVRLPARDIYDSARLVCRKWYHMIHTHTFIYAHLQHSTYGLLFLGMVGRMKKTFFIAVGESGRVEISENRYNNLRCPVETSCNGLFLELKLEEERRKYNLYVKNPATRQIFALPPFVVDYSIALGYELIGIAYAAASMKYKAVVLFWPDEGKKCICCIVTIGVDNSWRTVDLECELLKTIEFVHRPLITEGFVHWYITQTNEVLTMNVETEIITKTSGPIPRVVYRNRGDIYLSTGRYLSMLRPCGEFFWEVWEMKPKIDFQWRKVCDISLEAHKCSTLKRFGLKQYEFLIPTGWLKYLEVLVFVVNDRTWSQIFVFKLLTQEIVTIDLPFPRVYYDHVVHKNSLVWLDGC